MSTHRILIPSLLGVLCFSLAARPAHAELVTYFNFNDAVLVPGEGIGSNDPINGPVSDQITTLYPSETNSNSFELVPGTTLNALGDDEAGQALNYNGLADNGEATEASLEFQVDLTRFKDPVLSFASGQGNGDNSVYANLGYSIDGGELVDFGPSFFPDNSSGTNPPPFGVGVFDLSSVNELDGAQNVVFHIGGFHSPTANQYTFDNIQLNATLATPEPETWAMMGLGLVAVGWMGWKRRTSFAQ